MSRAMLKFAGIAIALCVAIGGPVFGATTLSVADDGGGSSQTTPPPTPDGHTWDG